MDGNLSLSETLIELYGYDQLQYIEPWLKEQVRLESFKPWFNSDVNKERLAQAGFFYAQECDYVQCYYCCIIIGNWTRGDNPFIEHKIHSPQCDFINGNYAHNIPLAGTEGKLKVELELVKNTDLNDPTASSLKTRIVKQSFKSLIQSARHPEYADKQVRLESFVNWPSGLKQGPEELSDAGFFYLGVGDEVKCFYCGGCLRNFSPNDLALNEHKKFFLPRCHFIQLRYKNLKANSNKLANRRPVKATGEQLQYLIAFMDENVDLRDGKLLQEREAYTKAWDNLARELNNWDGGANKDVKGWREVWRNYKYNLKRKSRKMEDPIDDLNGLQPQSNLSINSDVSENTMDCMNIYGNGQANYTIESIDELHLTEDVNVLESETAETHSDTIQPFQHQLSEVPMPDIETDKLNLHEKMDYVELVPKQIELEQKWHDCGQQIENPNNRSLQNELDVLDNEIEQIKYKVDQLNIEIEKWKLELELKSSKKELIKKQHELENQRNVRLENHKKLSSYRIEIADGKLNYIPINFNKI